MTKANINLMTAKNVREYHTCKYCDEIFHKKSQLERHFCTQKQRAMEQNNYFINGCYQLFAYWMKNRKMSPIHYTKERFRKSRYYVSFLKFARWSKDVSLVGRKKYIKYMADNNILPNIWTNEHMYEMYLENFDNIHNGKEQATSTARTMERLSTAIGCTNTEVFDYIGTKDLVKLIRTRNLSPWVLLSSKSFYKHLSQCDENRRIVIEATINPKQWRERLEESPEMMQEVKKVVKDLQL